MSKSGWCFGLPGTRVPHESCRWQLCDCACHPLRPLSNVGLVHDNGTSPRGEATPDAGSDHPPAYTGRG